MAKKQDNEAQAQPSAPEQPTITVEVDGKPIASATPAREEAKRLDRTIPGGRYIVNGRLVDCNNEPIEE